MKKIKSIEEFKETYLPFIFMAEQAAKMDKGEFRTWILKLTEEQKGLLEDAMLSLANEHQRMNRHILNLLDY